MFSMAMVFDYVSPVSYGLIPTWHLQRELYKVLRAVCNYHGSGCTRVISANDSEESSDNVWSLGSALKKRARQISQPRQE